MNKKIYLLVFAIFTCTTIAISCSDDKDIDNVDLNEQSLKSEITEESNGGVPRDKIIYSIFDKTETLSLNELMELYIKDANSAKQDYSTNLKNMWFAVLRTKVLNDGTDEQKLFFIKEQASLENNLPFFTDFYNLLATSKILNKAEKESMANEFYTKNINAINDIQWTTPDDKQNKISELIYAKRVFHNFINAQL